MLEQEQKNIGALECIVVNSKSEAIEQICVICHGFGASGSDLLPLAQLFAKSLPKTLFVVAQGPMDLSSQFGMADSRAWWHIDVGHVATAMAEGRYEEIQNSVPEGLAAARRKLKSCLDELSATYGLPYSKMILAGFSQGAMLSTDMALSLDEAPMGLAILSGTLICKQRWQKLAEKRNQFPIFQSHGTLDPVLPFANAQALQELLEEQDLSPQFERFDDQHTIPNQVVSRLERFLKTL